MPPASSDTSSHAGAGEQARGNRRAVPAGAVDDAAAGRAALRPSAPRADSAGWPGCRRCASSRARPARGRRRSSGALGAAARAATSGAEALGRARQVGPRRQALRARPAGSRRCDRSRCGRAASPPRARVPGAAMITIGRSRRSTVPAHVAYCPPRPMLRLPARCAAANSPGSRVSRICAPDACSASTLVERHRLQLARQRLVQRRPLLACSAPRRR